MRKNRLLLFAAILSLLASAAKADEGMWLPSLIEKGRIKDMKARGFELSAKDIYSVNEASLKDAIVLFGRGCTGEMISQQGLLMTNHHCGYGQIQAHSSIENDYLTYGFAAMNRGEELPNPGLQVKFLREMSDVTQQALNGVTDAMSETERQAKIKENSTKIKDEAINSKSGVSAAVESLYYGNQYFLFVYDVYEDVRLVFAPPSAVGKFGGDTDNWMWPRHTGDFSVFRIYADSLNRPAKYSASNVPFKPKKAFTISLDGMKEGDFTFVYGFPGTTMQYLHSSAVRYILEKGDPHKVNLRTIRLDVMNAAQNADPAVRIKYAAKNASVSNAWKKWQGEMKGVRRLGTIEKKESLEQAFEQWAENRPEYKGLVGRMASLYDSIEPYAFAKDYYAEAFKAVELLKYVASYIPLTPSSLDSVSLLEKYRKDASAFYKDYELSIDSTTAVMLLEELRSNIPAAYLPVAFNDTPTRKLVNELFEKSIFVDSSKVKRLLEMPVAEAYAQIASDPAFIIVKAFDKKEKADIIPNYNALNEQIVLLYRTYMRGLMAMQPNREFYPDANLTLRVAYGNVGGYSPADGVYYKPVSTLDGVMQKDNPEIYDYDVPEKLRQVFEQKDYGRWDVNGSVPVAFIATNHTTGGNSGSPVLNSRGELIGVNFDRTWEGTMSDIEYDPVVCRNIALDIRYALFIIDKVGGAGYLLDEMVFSKR